MIKCARCGLPLRVVGGAGATAVAACPKCGESDTRENILNEVDEYVRYALEEKVNSLLRQLYRNDERFELLAAPPRTRRFRFVVDL